ncbi:NB-ARC domain-containing protein [Actinosynnema sp. NPDC059335]|uniref:NB-ARC domain-containing protein n=1 Tax=Actinosynnema sp. NPDC059335 TaxID=3346804 RepID=UPI0036709369
MQSNAESPVHNVVSGTGAVVVQAGVVEGDVRVSDPSLAPVVPRQLPAAQESFTGRVVELAVLERTLLGTAEPLSAETGKAVVISAITGAGGVGKTWLALAWANRHIARYPDGQLFVDLRGFTPAGEPVDPAEALRGFLVALGVKPSLLPSDVVALAGLYRSLVAGRRMLVVLDNAATTAQVVPLLPGGGSCAVLVTSRHRLTGLVVGHGARSLTLDVFTDAEARALLDTSLGTERTANEERAVSTLIRLCGGFPLALTVIIARARFQPDRSLADVVTELGRFGLDALAELPPITRGGCYLDAVGAAGMVAGRA